MRLALNKEGWSRFRFDEIAQKISKTVNPADTDLERYIGLEHIDSEDIHIRRWGSPSDVKGGKLLCYPGDIIFGKRRAYQRKAAIVEEESICSAHAFVFRAIEEVILPEFLPFFLHSDSFMNRMVDISVGGLSPTINWGDLKNQEFLLPPKDQQAELAELHWAMDDLIENVRGLEKRFEELLLSAMKEKLSSSTHREKLIDLCLNKPKYGANSPSIPYDNYTRYIRITDIEEFGILSTQSVSAKETESKYLLKYGDFLLARTADPGRAYYYQNQDGRCIYAGYLIKFELDMSKVLPEFLFFFTQTKEFKSWISQTTRKGTLSNINSQEFSNMRVPLYSIDEQQKIINDISYYRELLTEAKNNLSSCLDLHSSVINQIF